MTNTQNNYEGMIDRYVYDVTRRLSKSQREDIDQELRGLIEDMLAARTGEAQPGKEDIEAVLIELGRPSELAAKYRGSKRFLIGPEYFDTYWLIVRIVMAATAFGITVALIVSLFTAPSGNVWAQIGNYFASVIMGVIQAFAWVTAVFALIERFTNKSEIKHIGNEMKGEWKPVDLPEVPKAKARISPGEPIAGIVFAVIALMIFNTVPHLIGIYVFSNPVVITPVFNLEVLKSMIIFIDILLCLSILKDAFRLVSGKHSLMLATVVTVINVAAIILVVTVFLPPTIWNGDMVTSLNAASDMTWAEKIDLQYIWSIVPKIIVGVSVFGYVVEAITSWVYGVRNAIKKVA